MKRSCGLRSSGAAASGDQKYRKVQKRSTVSTRALDLDRPKFHKVDEPKDPVGLGNFHEVPPVGADLEARVTAALAAADAATPQQVQAVTAAAMGRAAAYLRSCDGAVDGAAGVGVTHPTLVRFLGDEPDPKVAAVVTLLAMTWGRDSKARTFHNPRDGLYWAWTTHVIPPQRAGTSDCKDLNDALTRAVREIKNGKSGRLRPLQAAFAVCHIGAVIRAVVGRGLASFVINCLLAALAPSGSPLLMAATTAAAVVASDLPRALAEPEAELEGDGEIAAATATVTSTLRDCLHPGLIRDEKSMSADIPIRRVDFVTPKDSKAAALPAPMPVVSSDVLSLDKCFDEWSESEDVDFSKTQFTIDQWDDSIVGSLAQTMGRPGAAGWWY